MRVLMVVPRFVENFGDFYQFPLGLAYIASSLKQAGHAVYGLNLNHVRGGVETVADAVRMHAIDACCTGGLSPFLPEVKKVFVGARRGNRQVVNIAGGGVVSSDPEVAPQVMDIDLGVVGEGEVTICDALQALEKGTDLHQVAGIVFRDNTQKIVRTAHRASIMDLAQIPWPDYDVLGFGDHLHPAPARPSLLPAARTQCAALIDMVTSRSCPYSCTFCFHPVGKVYRERPLDEFFDELTARIDQYQINMVGISMNCSRCENPGCSNSANASNHSTYSGWSNCMYTAPTNMSWIPCSMPAAPISVTASRA